MFLQEKAIVDDNLRSGYLQVQNPVVDGLCRLQYANINSYDLHQWSHDLHQWSHDLHQWSHDLHQWSHDLQQWSHDLHQWSHDQLNFERWGYLKSSQALLQIGVHAPHFEGLVQSVLHWLTFVIVGSPLGWHGCSTLHQL